MTAVAGEQAARTQATRKPGDRSLQGCGKHAEQTWLFIDGASDFGGHEVMLARWVRELSAQGEVRPLVMCRQQSKLFSHVEEGSRARPLDSSAKSSARVSRARLHGLLRDALRFLSVVRNERPSVCVVAEGALVAEPLFVLLARALRVPLFVYVPIVEEARKMGFGRGSERDFVTRHIYANLPTAWITLTDEQARHFRAWSGTTRPVLVLPNTVEESIEALGDELAVADDKLEQAGLRRPIQVLVLGRLDSHQKGLDLLLDHLAGRADLVGRVQVSVVGSGSYENTLRRRVRDEAVLAALVHWRPWGDARHELRSCDALLMTSRYEGVPLVMLEAMALGRPVVAPRLPGTRAFLGERTLYAPGAIDDAFRIIEKLSNDAHLVQDIAHAQRLSYAQKASSRTFRRMVSELTRQMRELAGLPQRSDRSAGEVVP